MKQLSNLKHKGRRLELMRLVEDQIVNKLDEKLFEKARVEEQDTGYIQGQGQGGEKINVRIVEDSHSDHEGATSPCYRQIMLR